jgi:PIN domain nuclease of toxin-antitoxin system
MSLLLDTHVVLWWLADDPQLGRGAHDAIVGAPRVMVSPVTPWELEIKRALGKLVLPEDYLGAIAASGFESLAITMVHAVEAGRLPGPHRDPFDRMLVAQARAERLTIVSADPQIARYEVEVLDARQ